jgi:hypothetical protein
MANHAKDVQYLGGLVHTQEGQIRKQSARIAELEAALRVAQAEVRIYRKRMSSDTVETIHTQAKLDNAVLAKGNV